MFAKGEFVFYGSEGICKVDDVLPSPLEHMPKDCLYYVMHSLHDPNGVIYVPVDSDRVFLRSLMTREEAEALIAEIGAVLPMEESNAKLLREQYMLAMRKHMPIEWVRVIKTVNRRKENLMGRSQRISETERSFGESAAKFLRTELSLALALPEGELETYVLSRMEQTVS